MLVQQRVLLCQCNCVNDLGALWIRAPKSGDVTVPVELCLCGRSRVGLLLLWWHLWKVWTALDYLTSGVRTALEEPISGCGHSSRGLVFGGLVQRVAPPYVPKTETC